MRGAGLLLVLILATSACSVASRKGAEAGAAPTKPTIELVSIEPILGHVIPAKTIIKAVLRYSIPAFEPKKYFITPQFATNDPNLTTDGIPGFSNYPYLSSREGRAPLAYDLGVLSKSKTVARPFRVRFCLHLRTGPGTSRIVAATKELAIEVE
jgi:hypothetical protein